MRSTCNFSKRFFHENILKSVCMWRFESLLFKYVTHVYFTSRNCIAHFVLGILQKLRLAFKLHNLTFSSTHHLKIILYYFRQYTSKYLNHYMLFRHNKTLYSFFKIKKKPEKSTKLFRIRKMLHLLQIDSFLLVCLFHLLQSMIGL